MTKTRKLVLIIFFGIFLINFAYALPSVSINIKSSFSVGDKISYDYIFKPNINENIEYLASYSCPSATQELLEKKEVSLQKNKALKQTKTFFTVTEELEPQICQAIVVVTNGKEEKVYKKNFEIKKDEPFKFEAKINKKVFLAGETVYISYDSNYKDAIPSVTLVNPDKTRKSVLATSFVVVQEGKYTLEFNSRRKNTKGSILAEKIQKIDFVVLSSNVKISESRIRKEDRQGSFQIFQEFATESSLEYSFEGRWAEGEISKCVGNTYNRSFLRDGNWSTEAYANPYHCMDYAYNFNYSVPEDANTSTSKLRVKDFKGEDNLSIPANCIINNKIRFRAYDSISGDICWPISTAVLNWQCYNALGNWTTLRTSYICYNWGTSIFEEGMNWNITNASSGKEMHNYNLKDVFIISDTNWQDVMQLVPVTVWNEENNTECKKGHGTPDNICVYPTLILHKENEGSYDPDSIIHFLQQYIPERVILVGNTTQEFDNLLVSPAGSDYTGGAGVSPSQITRITENDLLNYWSNYKEIIYTENNYEKALLASTYASLKNVPLIVRGSSLDANGNFLGKNVTCIGDVSGSGRNCNQQYNIEEIKQIYKNKTKTNKLLLVNPDDLNIARSRVFQPQKSSNPINSIYTKNSLTAPFLASARKEIIISQNQTGGDGNGDLSNSSLPIIQDISAFIDGEINKFLDTTELNQSYLTIVASGNAIQYRYRMGDYLGFENYKALDFTEYSDYDNNTKPDLATGRLMGFSVSDTSSLIAETLFYRDMKKENPNMKFFATMVDEDSSLIDEANSWADSFRGIGYNAINITNSTEWGRFNPLDYPQQLLVSYGGHGSSSFSGIYNYEIPYLNSTIVMSDSCSNCAGWLSDVSFCGFMVRRGAVVHAGAVGYAWLGNNIYYNTLSNIFYKNLTIGQAFRNNYYTGNPLFWMTNLIADPAFNPEPEYLLGGVLPSKKKIAEEETLNVIQPVFDENLKKEESINININNKRVKISLNFNKNSLVKVVVTSTNSKQEEKPEIIVLNSIKKLNL